MRLTFAPKFLHHNELPAPSPRYRSNGRLTPAWTLIILSVLYLLTYTYYGYVGARDPTSFFFDKRHAYRQLYSKHRTDQAETFIDSVNKGAHVNRSNTTQPRLCVGIATVSRRGTQYVSTTVGSLVEGLTPSQRDSVFLNVLVAHTDPTKHSDADAEWMHILPDRVLRYDPQTADLDKIRAWEEGGWYRNKTIFDYTYLLKDCYDTGAEYIAMIEDDTIAARDWFEKAFEALESVATAMSARAHSRWAYLRLFYVEDLLGWNSEDWPSYLFWSFVLWTSLTSFMLYAKKAPHIPRQFQRQVNSISYTCIAIISGIGIPLFIGLFFMAGRQTVWPIKAGVQEMNKYGCCSQALVYPRSIVPLILSKADLTTDWLVDMMIERIADKERLERWAVVPALFQHIGTTSSKGYGFDDNARELWNFRFENHPF